MLAVEMRNVVQECCDEVTSGGFTVAAIVGDELGCDWAYTIGLGHNFDHPELLIAGLDASVAGAVLELLGAKVAAGERIGADTVVGLDGGFDLRARCIDPIWCAQGDWFNLGRQVLAQFGMRWPASMQLTWREADGRFPEPSDAPGARLRQPLLFVR
jgi:hypothetical protein